jgi:hypothetical protein
VVAVLIELNFDTEQRERLKAGGVDDKVVLAGKKITDTKFAGGPSLNRNSHAGAFIRNRNGCIRDGSSRGILHYTHQIATCGLTI